ncbi:hypothetical protein HanRHA438_Chr01g0004611 [Helianthus annuus]|nr:hypothetical protein HanRHA438_Chr01g0004611 [Helianthus annuus]
MCVCGFDRPEARTKGSNPNFSKINKLEVKSSQNQMHKHKFVITYLTLKRARWRLGKEAVK